MCVENLDEKRLVLSILNRDCSNTKLLFNKRILYFLPRLKWKTTSYILFYENQKQVITSHDKWRVILFGQVLSLSRLVKNLVKSYQINDLRIKYKSKPLTVRNDRTLFNGNAEKNGGYNTIFLFYWRRIMIL